MVIALCHVVEATRSIFEKNLCPRCMGESAREIQKQRKNVTCMSAQLIANGEIGNMVSVLKLVEEESEPTPDQKESKKALVEFVLENQLQLRNATPKTVLQFIASGMNGK